MESGLRARKSGRTFRIPEKQILGLNVFFSPFEKGSIIYVAQASLEIRILQLLFLEF